MAKLITVSENLLEDILPFLKGTKYDEKIKDLLENTNRFQTQDITYFPKKGKVERVVDGDTIVLENGSIVRYVGITCPEENQPYDQESTEFNRKLVEGKEITLEYDHYKADKFGRILAYVIVDGKNVSMELAKTGMAQVVVYQHKKPFIYQDQLLKLQEEAQKNKRGMWG